MINIALLIPSINSDEPIVETLEMIGTNIFKKMELKSIKLSVILISTPGPNGSLPNYEDIQRINPNFKYYIEHRIGYGRAYKTGFDKIKSDFDYIITADADGTYPLNKLDHIIEIIISQDVDFISISRMKTSYDNAFSFVRKNGNIIITYFINKIFNTKIRDSQSGMWIMSKEALEALDLNRLGEGMEFSYQIKILAYRNSNIKFLEVDLEYYPRKGGKSNFNLLVTPIKLFCSILKFNKLLQKWY